MKQVLKSSSHIVLPALVLTMCSLKFFISNLVPVGIPTFAAMARSMENEPHFARIGEAPYHVSIHRHGFPVCNGALTILPSGEQVAVTLATCVLVNQTRQAYPANNFVIVAGRINQKKLFGNEQSRKVRRIRWHRGAYWHIATAEKDVAVLFLKEPFKQTSVVDTIPLPVQWHPNSKVYILTGWGTVNADDPVPSDLLLVTTSLRHYDYTDCYNKYYYVDYDYSVYKDDTLCLLDPPPHKGHCAAERGSPVIGEAFAQPYLAGLFQWKHGKKCGDDWPGIYVDMKGFIEFFNVIAFENEIDTPDGYGKYNYSRIEFLRVLFNKSI